MINRCTRKRYAEVLEVGGSLGRRASPGNTLRSHHRAPQQRATFLAFHQQAAVQLGATTSAGRAKKDWGGSGSCWEGVLAMGVA